MKKLLLVLVLAANAIAIPQIVNYQGQLTSPTGTPLDTIVAITFNIWPTPAGGVSAWTETHPAVVVTDGLFNVQLGSITVLPDSFAVNRWLGITVGNNTEMIPREQLVSVAHAYRVGTVDGASGGTISSDLNIIGKANIGNGNVSSGTFAFVAGENDTASGDHSTVSGGFGNTASGLSANVGGGFDNTASGFHATVGGGFSNTASSVRTTVGGGQNNTASSPSATVSGGENNTASDAFATIGGGFENTASLSSTTVGGGEFNSASGTFATVGGGIDNAASASSATVGGGRNNAASGTGATVSGGQNNIASGQQGTVGGGIYNKARGLNSVVAGGGSGIEADSNSATGNSSFIGGGRRNLASGVVATIGGGEGNLSSSSRSTVGGGANNIASSTQSTVSGGEENAASGSHGFVGGGGFNYARGAFAAIAGGGGDAVTDSNSARGIASVIPGGRQNETSGSFSLAAGFRAKANHSGAFVWADSTNSDFASTAVDQFNVRASGGTRIFTNAATTLGAQLIANATAWTALSDSTRKTDIERVDTKVVLDKVMQIPISEWRYKEQPDASIRHIGPMAQDFWAQFHLGEDSLGISTIDPDGIALAAVQELAKQNEQKDTKIADLETRVKQLEAAILQFGNLINSDKQ
ncbi:MAG: tail fiber domain-containing protein [bacterium]|nr:tail fiber domain-containing protein [bacterium]